MADNFAEGTVELKAIGVDQIEAAMSKAAAAAKKTADEIAGVERALKKQIAQFGMNSKEIAVWELKAKGANQGQINSIMALTAHYERLQAKQKKQEEAAAAMSKTKAAVEEVTGALKKQMATYGLTADQIAIWELKAKGATAAQIIEVKKLQKEYAALQAVQAEKDKAAADEKSTKDTDDATAKATKTAVDNVTESLKKQTATFGMNADEIVVWELKQKGATDQQIASVQKLQAEYRELQDVQKKQLAGAGEKKPLGLFGMAKNFAGLSSQITGVIGGVAALGGIKMAADAIANLAQEATNLRLQYERGEITEKQFRDGVARSVPVVGSLYAAVMDGSRALQDYAAATLRSIPGNDKLAAAIESEATAAARAQHELKKLAEVYEMIDQLRTESLQGRDYSYFAKEQLVKAEADKKRAELDEQLPEKGTTTEVAGWFWNTKKTTPLTKEQQQARQDGLAAIKNREQEQLAKVWADADQAGKMLGVESGEDRGRQKRGELLASIEAENDALLKQIALWGKKGDSRRRAEMAFDGATTPDLQAIDRNQAELKRLAAEQAARGARISGALGVDNIGKIAANAGNIGGKIAGGGQKAMDDFSSLIEELEANLRYKGMTEDQKTYARFQEQGVSDADLAKLAKLQSMQEKQAAQTQFLSASGLADYMQQAIGNAPDQREALKAAKEAADAAKKQADCVEGKTIRVKVTSMPSSPATYA